MSKDDQLPHMDFSIVVRYMHTSVKIMLALAFLRSDDDHQPIHFRRCDWLLTRSLMELFLEHVDQLYFKIKKDNIQNFKKLGPGKKTAILRDLILQGNSNVMIGKLLNISEGTVRNHRRDFNL
jgi:hypothetical protein